MMRPALAFALALIGCGNLESVPLPELGEPSERVVPVLTLKLSGCDELGVYAAHYAVDQWSQATGINMIFADDGVVDITCVAGAATTLENGNVQRGLTSGSSVQVWLDGLDADRAAWVVAHEFGHVLDASRERIHPDGGQLMAPVIPTSISEVCISTEDAVYVCAHQSGCVTVRSTCRIVE